MSPDSKQPDWLKFKNLVEAIPGGVLALGVEGRIAYVSDSALSLLDLGREELLGKALANVVGEDFADLARRNIRTCTSGQPSMFEWKHWGRSGSESWIRVSLAPVGENAGMFVVLSDVSEERRVKAKLHEAEGRLRGAATADALRASQSKYRASQARLHAVFDNLPFACWTLDADGIFVLQNPPSEKRWGDVLGKCLSELEADAGFLRPWQEDVQRALAGQSPRRNVVIQEHGMSVHLRRLIVPIRDRETIIGCVGVSVDTTEQRRLETQLAQSQKLDAIGRLAGGIAHDFNNLLTAIMSCARLLERRLEGPPRPEVQIIRDGSQRAADLTKQLLAFAKQEVVDPRRSVIDDIIIKSDRLLRRLIGEDIELVTLANSRGAEVVIDPVRMEQAIINLVVNARDAMPKGGKISVRCEAVELSEFAPSVVGSIPPGKYARVLVEDAGVGMNEETRLRAFEPFFTTRQDSGGTGLGLSSVYGSVQQAEGFVTLDSVLGEGTMVGLYIPLAAPSEEEDGPKSDELEVAAVGGTETILVVEDEPLVMSAACQSLQMSGYTVLEARSSQQAMEVANQHRGPIDLLLTDVVMPHGSGPELAANLRATRPDISVLYMSGYTSERIEMDADSEEFLAKPFTPDGLDTKVRRILDAKKSA